MANPRFAWGIDVGNRALKAVKLVRDGAGGMRVDDVDVIEHEHILSDAGDNKETLITTALNTFAAKHPEKGGADVDRQEARGDPLPHPPVRAPRRRDDEDQERDRGHRGGHAQRDLGNR